MALLGIHSRACSASGPGVARQVAAASPATSSQPGAPRVDALAATFQRIGLCRIDSGSQGLLDYVEQQLNWRAVRPHTYLSLGDRRGANPNPQIMHVRNAELLAAYKLKNRDNLPRLGSTTGNHFQNVQKEGNAEALDWLVK